MRIISIANTLHDHLNIIEISLLQILLRLSLILRLRKTVMYLLFFTARIDANANTAQYEATNTSQATNEKPFQTSETLEPFFKLFNEISIKVRPILKAKTWVQILLGHMDTHDDPICIFYLIGWAYRHNLILPNQTLILNIQCISAPMQWNNNILHLFEF